MSEPHRLRTPRLRRTPADNSSHGVRVEQLKLDWESLSEQMPQSLGATYWFDPDEVGVSGDVTIRFTGRRVQSKAKTGPGDRFTIDEDLEVMPGSGLVTVTTRVGDINPGTWQVTAMLVRASSVGNSHAQRPFPMVSALGITAYAPVLQLRAPGVHLGAWPALVGAGALVGLVTQGLLAEHLHLPVIRVLVVSVVAAIVGLVGAKLYYAVGHYITGERKARELLGGAGIQGFVLAAGATLLLGAEIAGLPLGTILDLTAPGLLFGMTIGRYGCFFGGCCVGRPTSGRWSLWSSDRRLGIRRVPVQLLESATALTIGLGAFMVDWSAPVGHAQVLVGALAAYTLGRQLLFSLRASSRHTRHGRVVVVVTSSVVFIVDLAVALLAH